MDSTLFFIILIPVALSLSAKYLLRLHISWLEFVSQFIVGTLVLSLVWGIGSMAKTSDREVWNGAVTSKAVEYERCYTNMMASVCENRYDCNCVTVCTPQTDSKGNVTGQSCTTTCDTCYRYPWEQDWNVNTNLDRQFEISRVDAQGAQEPPRYTRTQVGDPVSITRPFKNWVKASSGTLFRDADSGLETYKEILPKYPLDIFDYYRIDRVVTPNVRLANEAVWNREISASLSTLGPARHVNAIFVFAKDVPQDYAYAVRRKWDGFKQNDAVVIVGLRGGNVAWVEVMSWSKNALFDVQLRQMMNSYVGQPITSVNPVVVMDAFETITMANFERRSMEEFEYLKGDIKPPSWLSWLSVILAIVLGAGGCYVFHRIDLDEMIFKRNRRSSFNRYY